MANFIGRDARKLLAVRIQTVPKLVVLKTGFALKSPGEFLKITLAGAYPKTIKSEVRQGYWEF